MAKFEAILTQKKERGFLLTRLRLIIPDLPPEFSGYRIAQLTDLHFGQLTSARHIGRAIDIAAAFEPHLVLLTGDYITAGSVGIHHYLATSVNPQVFNWLTYRRAVRSLAEQLSQMLSRLNPRDGIFGVFGNHDHLEGIGTITRQLGNQIQWLTNSSVEIQRGSSSIRIAGIDDLNRGKPDLMRAMARVKAEDDIFSILLSHNPDITLHAKENALNPFHLILSGHTHGGQIRLPFWGPIMTRTKQKNLVRGLGFFGESAIYVNQGIGYGLLPIRVLCPPEILEIVLERG